MTEHKAGGSTPQQYGLPDGATDLQDLIEYRGMNFAQGNIFKAQYRTGHCDHSDALREARKTLWFAQREVDRLEREAGVDAEDNHAMLDDLLAYINEPKLGDVLTYRGDPAPGKVLNTRNPARYPWVVGQPETD